jgi:hypothetical protein
MSYLPIHYITFKPLTSNHIPVIKEWLSCPEIKANQNSLVSLDVFHHQEELLLNGFVDIEGNKKPLRPFVIYDNTNVCGYTHFYQTTQEPNQGAALAICFTKPLTEDRLKETAYIELFLENYVYPEYKFCIVDIDRSNIPFIELFKNIGFSLHTDMDDFLIMIHHSTSE